MAFALWYYVSLFKHLLPCWAVEWRMRKVKPEKISPVGKLLAHPVIPLCFCCTGGTGRLIYFSFIGVCVLPESMSVHHVCEVSEKSRRWHQILLVLELQMVGSHYVGAWDWTLVLLEEKPSQPPALVSGRQEIPKSTGKVLIITRELRSWYEISDSVPWRLRLDFHFIYLNSFGDYCFILLI